MLLECKYFKLDVPVDIISCTSSLFQRLVCLVRAVVIVLDADISSNPAGFVCMKRSFGGNFGTMMTILDIFCRVIQDILFFTLRYIFWVHLLNKQCLRTIFSSSKRFLVHTCKAHSFHVEAVSWWLRVLNVIQTGCSKKENEKPSINI